MSTSALRVRKSAGRRDTFLRSNLLKMLDWASTADGSVTTRSIRHPALARAKRQRREQRNTRT